MRFNLATVEKNDGKRFAGDIGGLSVGQCTVPYGLNPFA